MSTDHIASNIKNYRTSKKLSQQKLGTTLGVTPQAVSKWENKTAYPDILMLPVIAELIGTTVDELILTEIKFDK